MKKRFSCVLALVMALLLLLPAVSAEGFHNDVEAMNRAALSVYKLEAYSNGTLFATGSGFVAFGEHIMVTNYHVIESADKIVAISDEGNSYELYQVIWADQKWDYALLVFPNGGTPLAVGTSEPQRGGRCVAIGSPRGARNTFSEGMISGFYELEDREGVTYIQFNAPITHGSSGGALFNDQGEVIGITQGGYSDTDNANLNYAVDMRDVARGYREHGSEQPIPISEAYTIADSSFQDDYSVGDLLSGGDLAVRVTRDFDVYTYSGTVYMRKGDVRIRVNALDMDDLGWIGLGVGLLGRFMNTNDLALKSFAGAEFDTSFEDSDLQHPSIASGAETAMIRAFSTEYNGAQNNVCMAMVHEDTTFFCVIGNCPSGSNGDMEQAMLLALNCIEIVR